MDIRLEYAASNMAKLRSSSNPRGEDVNEATAAIKTMSPPKTKPPKSTTPPKTKPPKTTTPHTTTPKTKPSKTTTAPKTTPPPLGVEPGVAEKVTDIPPPITDRPEYPSKVNVVFSRRGKSVRSVAKNKVGKVGEYKESTDVVVNEDKGVKVVSDVGGSEVGKGGDDRKGDESVESGSDKPAESGSDGGNGDEPTESGSEYVAESGSDDSDERINTDDTEDEHVVEEEVEEELVVEKVSQKTPKLRAKPRLVAGKVGMGKKQKVMKEEGAVHGESKAKVDRKRKVAAKVGTGKKPKVMKEEGVVHGESKDSVLVCYESPSKKQTLVPKIVKKKPLTADQAKKAEFSNKFPPLFSRTVPASLFEVINEAVHVDMEQFLNEIGFCNWWGLKVDSLPNRLARVAVKAFKKSTYEFKIDTGSFQVTPEKIHEILGLPISGISLFDLPKRSIEDSVVMSWLQQFAPKVPKKITAKDISQKLLKAKEIDFMFKLNFLTLFATVMGDADTMKAIPRLNVVRHIHEETDIAKVDWCRFIHSCCLREGLEPNTLEGFYTGPLYFLILLYLDSTKYDRFSVVRSRPAIRDWSSTDMHTRQELEFVDQVFGNLELHGEWSAAEAKKTEGFFGASDVKKKNKASGVPPKDKKSICTVIEEKLSRVTKEKGELETLLRRANKELPNDVQVDDLYHRYLRLFRDTLWLEEKSPHLDDFDDVNPKKDDQNKDNEKKDKPAADADEKIDEPAVDAAERRDEPVADAAGKGDTGKETTDTENVVAEEAPVDKLDEETFTQWIENNIVWYGELVDIAVESFGREEEYFAWPSDFPLPGGVPAPPLPGGMPAPPLPGGVPAPPLPGGVPALLLPGAVPPATPPQQPLCSPLENKKVTIVQPDSPLTSVYQYKRINVACMINRVEFILGNSLFAMQGEKYETVFQTRSGYDLSAVRINMETLAPRLWIDASVIDCYVAILNAEHDSKLPDKKYHYFSTGCIKPDMISGVLGEEAAFKIFEETILAQFEGVEASASLKDVELAFFPICASNHFYVVVFNLKAPTTMLILDNAHGYTYTAKYKGACDLLRKFFGRYLKEHKHPSHSKVSNIRSYIPKLKWSTTQNHEDCGVFAMIHLENYTGDSRKSWDVGLCEESDEQRTLLMRMRFKIATKILLHDFNKEKAKMFKLAYDFETKFDKETRIKIIVHALRNRNERDPEKTSAQKGDVAQKEAN